ncbi:hypothetical protein FOZ60_011694 [Perkinsus olseni]|uniref:Uncharacterized protein n=1 Tax=Perkinsus olseni TaxID=32597 RepID=A0A7J6NCW3_PEROL|nr:hypothetical protein FOZ60_011694 [Perkinsus olseni]
MRHISRCLLSKGEEATPLFWAWLRDFEDQAESIINAKDELFTLNVLTRQFRDDIKIFVEDFGETVLGPFSIAEGLCSHATWMLLGWTSPTAWLELFLRTSRRCCCYARSSGERLRYWNSCGKRGRHPCSPVQRRVSPKWVLASSKWLVEDAENAFKGALVSQGKVVMGVAANPEASGFVVASEGDVRLYGYRRLEECAREKRYTILRDPQNEPLTTAKLDSVNCDIPRVEPEATKGSSDIYPDYYTRAQLKLASGRLSGIAPEHTSPEALERLHEDLLKNDYAVYTPDAYTAETFP